jgi:hypothetical protein
MMEIERRSAGDSVIMGGDGMKLTAELVFDRLSENFDVLYAISSDKNTLVGRPVFYQNTFVNSDHLIIVRSPEPSWQSPEKGVLICIGTPPDFSVSGVELMTVPESVPSDALFNRLQEIFDYYVAWENDLTEIIEADKSYNELIDCATSYLGCPISLVDVDFTIIAFADNLGGDFRDTVDKDKVSASIMSEMLSDPMFAKGLYVSDIFEHNLGGENFLAYNFKRDGMYLGRVTLYIRQACRKAPAGICFAF